MSLRSTWLNVLSCAASGLGALVLLLYGVILISNPGMFENHKKGHIFTHTDAVLTGLGLLLGAAVVIFAIIRMARCGISIEADQVTVRTVGRTEIYSFDEIAGVAMQPAIRDWMFRAALVLKTGEIVPSPWSAASSASPALRNQLAALPAVFNRASATAVLQHNGRLGAPSPKFQALGGSTFNSPPGWAPPPPGWVPPPSWQPPPEWPAAPADWQWWRVDTMPMATATPLIGRDSAPPVLESDARKWLKLETITVMIAFLVPALAGAVGELLIATGSSKHLNEFALPVHGKFTLSLVILIISYVATAATVPIGLLLLARTGQTPEVLGLTPKKIRQDILPAIGINLLVFFWLSVLSIVVLRFIVNSGAANNPKDSFVPYSFILYGFFVSMTTAINEEVFVNGYLTTRLAQLGWKPWPAFALSLTLRTSYHLYYGAAIVSTIPFGFFVTRSFQKHRRLARAILAHFFNDFLLFTITIISLHHH